MLRRVRLTTFATESNKYLIFRERVFVAFLTEQAKRLRSNIPLSSAAYLAPSYFSTLSHKRQDFQEKNENGIYILIFSTTFV